MPQTRAKSPAPFSLRLSPETRTRLDNEARKVDRSASYVATKAIEAFLDAREAKRRAIGEAIVEADKGAFISSRAMGEWIDSWGKENEVSPPQPDVRFDDDGK